MVKVCDGCNAVLYEVHEYGKRFRVERSTIITGSGGYEFCACACYFKWREDNYGDRDINTDAMSKPNNCE